MKQHLISSELSWLYFNQCIVDEAADSTNPLFERIKFLAIFSSNLDEFFRVKVNHLVTNLENTNTDTLTTILNEVNLQQEQIGDIWRNNIIPELRQHNIVFYDGLPVSPNHKIEIEHYFKTIILSYIQLVFIKNKKQKPYFLQNRGLYYLVKLTNVNGDTEYAYLNIPSDKLQRFRLLQREGDTLFIISIDEIIKKCLHLIFPQYEINSCFAIKMNRDEDYEIEDESTGNLIHKIKDKIKDRKAGSPTRFLYDGTMPSAEIDLCQQIFKLKSIEMVAGGTQHNLFDLFQFPNPLKPAHQNIKLPALYHKDFGKSDSIFEVIDTKNHLLHFPYHTYDYVLQFFNQAAVDYRVTEIKVTLYRISSQSQIANALISAAKNGKKVTVFVEIKARFDENNNLHWANEMKKAGIKIIYSLPNLKVHAKIAMVTMKIDAQTTRQYSYLSTGNFNENTASVYADHGFFTSENKYSDDIAKVFQFLKSKEKNEPMKTLLVAGFNLKQQILGLMDNEIENHKAGKSSGILLKINGLDEKDIINKLCEASSAGVKIILLVRGICTLLPEIKSVSENIKIFKIVDMFLEHARIYKFNNGGDEKLFLSSADMMGRNLNNRIEVGFPIDDSDLKQEINHILQLQLEDNTKKRTINSEGKTVLIPNVQSPRRGQIDIYNWVKERNI